ncbi:MAG: 5'-deoxynucleotidase [Christensenellaceae bacterium]|jgi:5'-deoxynucleotidase|nr:5'-deoxynucleotidase [Christensenellaceae bacterium]
MKSFNFFACVGRMKHIRRWSLMRSIIPENLLEHSAQVVQIAHALAVINNTVFNGSIDPGEVAIASVYHDVAEVLTGDLPTPIKYYNPAIASAFSEIEVKSANKLLNLLPDELKPKYQAIFNIPKTSQVSKFVKAADRLSAHIKCIEELQNGNKEFSQAFKATKASVLEIDLPEVKYFINHFLNAFYLTLDELQDDSRE